MQKLIWIAVAGGMGSLARFGLSGLVHRIYSGELPLGTAAVNIIGCFLFGLFWSLAEQRLSISGEVRLIVLVGFMGAFTTFSTFVYESGQLIRDSEWAFALANIFLQNLVGLAFLFVGLKLGQNV